MNENDLLQKLMISKQIMDKSMSVKTPTRPFTESLEDFDTPQANYNIPEGLLEQPTMKPVSTKQPSIEAIKNSRLPEEIKRLMIEHPIVPPQMQGGPTLTNELVEKASRLMGSQKTQTQSSQQPQNKKQIVTENVDYSKIQKMIEDTLNKVLKENGMLVESFEKSNDNFTFRVGKHIFEGKVTKIKKVS